MSDRKSHKNIVSTRPNPPILPTTTMSDWPAIRQDIRTRVERTLGTVPEGIVSQPDFQEIRRYENYGLTHILYKYRVIDDEWNEGICILPEGGETSLPAPCVLTVHGTTPEGKSTMMDREGTPRRFYAVELAQRGFLVFAPDQYAYGPGFDYAKMDYEKIKDIFYEKYPDWSLDSRRLYEQKLAMDLIDSLGMAIQDKYGVIGNSLGGRAAMMLTALEERIFCGVSSMGITPNYMYTYKALSQRHYNNPGIMEDIKADGIPSWEYHELISLMAPRALLAVESYVDPWSSPDVMAAFECVHAAYPVYQLHGVPERLAIFVHGDGHDTIDDVRNMAYDWLIRYLQ